MVIKLASPSANSKPTKAAKAVAQSPARGSKVFYKMTLPLIKEGEAFYLEYVIFQKTVEAVNGFHSLYRTARKGARGGPATHAQQDLSRAMLVFACAGLDVLVKQLVKTKLARLIEADKGVGERFKQFVRKGLERNEKEVLSTVALALIDQNPREVLLRDYIDSMTDDSLQSVEELHRVSSASGLEVTKIFSNDRRNRLRDAFIVRNQIIHEMDIMVETGASRTTGHRTRRQRQSPLMEKHTTEILDLGQELLLAFKGRYAALKIEVEKAHKKA